MYKLLLFLGEPSINRDRSVCTIPIQRRLLQPTDGIPIATATNPGFINYPQMSPQVDNNQAVSPAEIKIIDVTLYPELNEPIWWGMSSCG